MAALKGLIRDSTSGAAVAAKVHVLNSSGNFVHPPDSLMKVGPGDPFFYCDGEFSVNAPRGSTDIVVERGTEYEPLRQVVDMPSKGAVEVELWLKRWTDLPSEHWYPGNTQTPVGYGCAHEMFCFLISLARSNRLAKPKTLLIIRTGQRERHWHYFSHSKKLPTMKKRWNMLM